ncbi:hypothetical protein NDU88_000051 [Pleurodeles waltl]|uniref:Gypsy retrotransposon integrase-like protein 1 n=1 Tax=Pleurodeles waltl TaxID=8319 RepID=A0AAV7S7L6_PLEWA|nr:hypothetical protein NDU88_000051 [Pleurodeles waltl]
MGLDTHGGSSSIPHSHPAKEHDSRNLHKIVPPYKEGDDINKWFAALERACAVQDVPQKQWAAILWLSFTGKGRDRLLTVKENDANNFQVLKNALLDGYGLTTEQYRIKFRDTKKESSQDWVDFIDQAVKALEGWLHGSKVTDYDSLYNLILREHILNNCVSDLLHQYLVDSDLTSPQELGKKADKWVRTRVNRKVHTGGDKDGNKKKDGKSSDKGGDKSKNESSSGPQKHSGGGGGPKSSFNQNKEKKPWCYLCKIKGHWTTDPSCPKKGTTAPTTTTPTATPSVPTNSSGVGSKPTNSQSKGVAGLTFGNLVGVGLIRETTEATLVSEGAIDLATLVACPHNLEKYKQLTLINGVEVQAYRDTGASVTMVIEKLVHPEQHILGHQYQVTDAHNITQSHPMAVVNLNWGGVSGPKKVVVASDLPVDCLLGNDLETSAWSDVELEAHAAMLGIPGHIFALTRAQAKKQKGQGSLDPGTMDQVLPKARASRSKPLPTIPPSTVDSTSEEEEFPPCAEPTPEELEADTAELLGEGGPAREELSVAQQTCPTLEGLRQQAVKQANGDVSDSHRVYWEDNLLYTEHRDPKPGAARRLVIPQEYRKFLLTLAHDIPLAGHLGQMKTWDRLVPLFHWPRMSEDTKEFCKSCETCQASGKTGGTPKAPLIPLPVVGVPFERVGVDIVGPLDPPTASGNRFILVVVDHATRYPEAIPLRTTTAPAVAKALLGIFSRVGFPKEVVSDRGSNFMSAYLKAMWKECGVTYKFTTPYHPQTNGLVERFNKTLKGMIMGLPEKLRRRWDILLPCLLFAYREVPQKGVGFSPFELLFGHPVRGPLTLVKEGWEQPFKAPKQDIVDYVLGLRSRMAEYMKKASKNLQASQELQKQWHDQKAVLVQYQPGQKVWVLEPVAPRALQDKWSGPHTIVEKKGEVTYLVDLGTARSPLRVLHVNRLKPYYDRADLTLLMATDEGQEEDSDPLPDLFSSTEQDALVEGVVLADCLTAEQKDNCMNLLGQFSELFSIVPGTTSWCEHTIDTGDSLPVKSKIYRQPDHVRDCIKQEVQKMLELGVVEHSDSPWASPVVLVPKPNSKDGKKEMRFCVDYRGLNLVTKTDAHPIPRADELIDTLASAKYLSTFDLTAWYWQIKLSEDAKSKTAFSTIGGHYQFTVMPFGLKNAPATFQRLVNTVLQGLEAFSAAYLDDIAVFSSSWDDHLVHLWKVLEALQKAGLTIKASKCQIGQGKVVYLGHLVGGEQIAPLQGKIQTIIDWVPPTTQTQVRAFLGLTGNYRRFIKNYGSIAAPLNDLTSKKMPKKVLWTANCQKAFEELKQAMCSAPVLKSPCYSKQLYVQTDASELGVGAVLSQLNSEGQDQPVAFISRRLTPREKRWSAIEREAFAVVWALKKLRPYLFGTHFIVQTDHKPLLWLKQMKGENPKLLRWSISLQGMDYTVEHRPGSSHSNADGLSRYFHLDNEDSSGNG